MSRDTAQEADPLMAAPRAGTSEAVPRDVRILVFVAAGLLVCAAMGLAEARQHPAQITRQEAPHPAIDELRQAVHRRLRRAKSEAARVLEGAEWPTIRRPGETRASAHHRCEPGATAAPLHRGRRCHW